MILHPFGWPTLVQRVASHIRYASEHNSDYYDHCKRVTGSQWSEQELGVISGSFHRCGRKHFMIVAAWNIIALLYSRTSAFWCPQTIIDVNVDVYKNADDATGSPPSLPK